MSDAHFPLTVAIGPFATVDADTGERIMKNRTHLSAAAFMRGDKYTEANPSRDFKILDARGRVVPRPHGELPSPGFRERRLRSIVRAAFG